MQVNKWSRGRIREWIQGEPESRLLRTEEQSHVAECISQIVDWYTGAIPTYLVDDFIVEVLRDSLSRAWGEADEVNRKALGLYVKFLYNNVGADWRSRAKSDFGDPEY